LRTDRKSVLGGIAGPAFTVGRSRLVVELVDDMKRSDSVRVFSRGDSALTTFDAGFASAAVGLDALDLKSSPVVAGLLSSGDFFTRPEVNDSGKPEMLSGLEWPPIGGERRRLVVLTSKFAGGGLPMEALALCMLTFQAGSSGLEGSVFGDSGLARALSSQLDFVGIHRRASMVFVGLADKA
jgi:hypothetical protein